MYRFKHGLLPPLLGGEDGQRPALVTPGALLVCLLGAGPILGRAGDRGLGAIPRRGVRLAAMTVAGRELRHLRPRRPRTAHRLAVVPRLGVVVLPVELT